MNNSQRRRVEAIRRRAYKALIDRFHRARELVAVLAPAATNALSDCIHKHRLFAHVVSPPAGLPTPRIAQSRRRRWRAGAQATVCIGVAT